ncbi:MAG: ornithine carbamoyltransferase [Coriobacteriales bacterium]|jgi:ornithine carbamoyltransferase|nr:ornithine carbamoyltransferase [Coriobacteriales bacterium]
MTDSPTPAAALPNWAALDSAPTLLAGNTLAGRDLLRLLDLAPAELHLVLSTAVAQKSAWKTNALQEVAQAPYKDKAVGIIMEKPSLRTRISFEIGTQRLGAHPAVMSDTSSAFSRGESVKDTVQVLERFVDAIVLRTFEQSKLEEVSQWASVPVINALSDDFHPCQGLADVLTMYEHKGDLSKLKVAYVGDGNNMAHTYLEAAALIGFELHIATPAGYEPNERIINECSAAAAEHATGAKITVDGDVSAALAGANVVITDTWTSMGDEGQAQKRQQAFASFTIDAAAMAQAAPDAIFMHCLPAHRGEEVTDEVMDSAQSAIYDEAENRLHAQKALMALVLAPTA